MHVPLFGYFAVVGGFLLSMLFIVNVFLPATSVDGGSQTHQSKSKILIDSSRKWPARIVYDTSLPTTLAVVPVAQRQFVHPWILWLKYQRRPHLNSQFTFKL